LSPRDKPKFDSIQKNIEDLVKIGYTEKFIKAFCNTIIAQAGGR